MYVDVLNGSLREKYILAEAAYYFGERLMPKNVFNEISLQIELTSSDNAGNCLVEDDVSKSPRLFYIELTRSGDVGTYNRIKTLAHEMVHLKQHALNELTYTDRDVTFQGQKSFCVWKGRLYTEKEVGKMNYWEEPWELEAFSKEEGLTLNFCKDNFYLDKPWFKKRYSP